MALIQSARPFFVEFSLRASFEMGQSDFYSERKKEFYFKSKNRIEEGTKEKWKSTSKERNLKLSKSKLKLKRQIRPSKESK